MMHSCSRATSENFTLIWILDCSLGNETPPTSLELALHGAPSWLKDTHTTGLFVSMDPGLLAW